MNKNRRILRALAIMAVGICSLLLAARAKTVVISPVVPVKAQEAQYRHEVETYVSALEWCESRGVYGALNPKDRDGTPSFSNFQWKPETLLSYGKKYGLIVPGAALSDVPVLLRDYALQRAIVIDMVADPSVDFAQQFPDCTKKKIGYPPHSNGI